MLLGRYPFFHKDKDIVENKILNKSHHYKEGEKQMFSRGFRKLIKHLLEKDFRKRLDVSEAIFELFQILKT